MSAPGAGVLAPGWYSVPTFSHGLREERVSGTGGMTETADEPGALLDAPDTGMSLHERLALSYRDMRRAVRSLIEEQPSEARLLFFVLLSDVIFFLSWTLSLVVSPGAETRTQLPAEIALLLVLIFLCRTATLYAFSGLVGAVCRLCGGQGSWRDTRTGVFWASLAAAPVGVAAAVVAGLVRLLAGDAVDEAAVVGLRFSAGFVVFVFLVSASVAEAQRFRATSPVFIAFSILAIGLAALALPHLSGG